MMSLILVVRPNYTLRGKTPYSIIKPETYLSTFKKYPIIGWGVSLVQLLSFTA
jgi:hypothetical protein